MLPKPTALFDRDAEWADLARFAADPGQGARLALVYGRRRQGKTLLLELLTEASHGFLFTAAEQSDVQNLADLSSAYTSYVRAPGPVRFASWPEAIDALLQVGTQRAVPVVIDEFGYLIAQNAAIPSLLQKALSPRGRARQASRTRLILCRSALATMRRLLEGPAPLRGRAAMELLVHPFEFREAAHFWGLAGRWRTAAAVHALVGGTPAYRDFCAGDAPVDDDDLDPWVVRNLLNPSSPLFREGRILLAEDPDITNAAPYLAVLAAIAGGRTRRGEIAAAVGRAPGALHHPLSVLAEAALIESHDDAFRAKRTSFTLAEPVLRLHQLVIRPNEARLTARRGTAVWSQSADTVASRIYGPHFERLARAWTLLHASSTTLGGTPSRVQPTVLHRTNDRVSREIDLVAIEHRPGSGDRVLAIGEAKWCARPIGTDQLDRLRALRAQLPTGPAGVRLLLFSSAGFTAELTAAAATAGDVELVDLPRLYTGS
ncbi:MAG: hypothetical protein L0H84_20025 [Pseudonocardia sp.]|nr:hypothetical protein [Pseudonocardia sp.]